MSCKSHSTIATISEVTEKLYKLYVTEYNNHLPNILWDVKMDHGQHTKLLLLKTQATHC